MHHRPSPSLPTACLLILLASLLTACAAPTAATDGAPLTGTDQAQHATDARTAPVIVQPLTPPPLPPPVKRPIDRPQPAAGAEVTLDYSCSSNDDCAVKNVGNCCGYYPACVNKDSPTDPAAVQAQCAKEGRVGVCGFPSISSCQCVQGRCEGSSQMLPAL